MRHTHTDDLNIGDYFVVLPILRIVSIFRNAYRQDAINQLLTGERTLFE